MTKTRDLANLGGGFIQAGTGAVQRTVASKLRDVVSVKDFIPAGVVTATTDCSPYFQAAADAAIAATSSGGVYGLYVPTGRYLIGSRITLSYPGGGYSDALQGICIFGDGQNSSILVASTSNSDGVIYMNSGGNTEIWEIKDLSILASRSIVSNGGTNGTAIAIASQLDPGEFGFGSHTFGSARINNVSVGSLGSYSNPESLDQGTWTKGIHIKNKWWPVLQNVVVHTGTTGSTPPTYPSGSIGIYLENTYSPIVDTFYVYGDFYTGIFYESTESTGEGSEDLRFTNGFVVGPVSGVSIKHTNDDPAGLYEPGGLISGMHIACLLDGLTIDRHRQLIVDSCYFYVSVGYPTVGDGFTSCIRLTAAADVSINNCQFLEPGFYNSDLSCSSGIVFAGPCDGVSVSSCHFNHGGIPIVFLSSASVKNTNKPYIKDITFGGDGWWGATKVYADFSPGKLCRVLSDNKSNNIREYYTTKLDTSNRLHESYWKSVNSSGSPYSYCVEAISVDDATAGSEDSSYGLYLSKAGSLIASYTVDSVGLNLNSGLKYMVGGLQGATGSFTAGVNTVTVTGGIITSIV